MTGATERDIKASIRLALGRNPDVRLFNNPVGQAWTGHVTSLPDGAVLIRNPRRVVYGLATGSGDLVGWTSVVVTPDMIGQRLAVFTSCEVKTALGRPTAEQVNWAKAVTGFGGRAGVVRSADEAVALVGVRTE